MVPKGIPSDMNDKGVAGGKSPEVLSFRSSERKFVPKGDKKPGIRTQHYGASCFWVLAGKWATMGGKEEKKGLTVLFIAGEVGGGFLRKREVD